MLHVAHEEQVVGPADAVQNGLLDPVAVLVLVHDDGREPIPILLSGLVVLQNFRAEVLEIVEVDPVPVPLHGVVYGLLPLPQADEGQQHLGGGKIHPPLAVHVALVDTELILDLVLQLLAGLFEDLSVRLLHVLGVGDLTEGHGSQRLGVVGGGPLQQGPPAVGDGLVQVGDQLPPGGGVAVPQADEVLEGRLKGGLVLLEADEHPPVEGLPAGQVFLRLTEPARRVRLGHEKGGQGVQGPLHPVLPLEGADEALIAGGVLGGQGGQRFLRGLVPQNGALRLVQGSGRRGQAHQVEVSVHHPAAEGVDGGDAGVGASGALAIEPGPRGPLAGGGPLLQGRLDALLHLGGGGPGEGEDQEPIDVHAPLHQADHPLREHGGLARASGGGHDQIPLFLNGALLFSGPVHFSLSAISKSSAIVIFPASRS